MEERPTGSWSRSPRAAFTLFVVALTIHPGGRRSDASGSLEGSRLVPQEHSTHDPDAVASAALGVLLDAYPAQLSSEEVIRLMRRDPSVFTEQDDVAVAVSDLVSHGLAHRHGGFVLASQAAARFNDLGVLTVRRSKGQ